MKQALILGDIHAPFHDKLALKLVKKLIKKFRFSQVISVGDFTDQLAVARFSRSRKTQHNIQWEIDEAIKLAEELVDCNPRSRFVVTLGNHDIRIDKKLDSLRNELDVGDIASLNVSERMEEAGWEVVDYNDSYELTEHLDVTHDFGRSGKGAIQQAASVYGRAVVFGHTHKAGLWFEGGMVTDVHGYMNVGWLGDAKEINYAHGRLVAKQCVQGVGIVTLGPDGLYHLSFSPFIRRGKKMMTCVNGQWVKV